MVDPAGYSAHTPTDDRCARKSGFDNRSKDPARIYLSPPHMGGAELNFVKEAFESNFIAPLGPQVDAFEREFADYIGLEHCAAVSSGTAALHVGLRHIGVGPGDEVLVSTLTFIGGVSPVVFQGATPVFIDCERQSWTMDPALVEEALESCARQGKLPKAVVPTDLYGQCCNLDRILEICERFGIPVICDSAEAMGAQHLRKRLKDTKTTNDNLKSRIWEHAGIGATAAAYSFNGNKIITTSGGGMLASNDRELIDSARFLSQQAREPLPNYEHTEIGYNYRMSNILAAIGRGQLRVLDDRVKRRREIFDYYRNALGDLPGVEFMPEASYSKSNRWLTVILVTPEKFRADRDTIRQTLEVQNIESRPVWKPMHLQPVFDIQPNRRLAGSPVCNNLKSGKKPKKQYEAKIVGGSVAEDLFDRGLCLPSGTAIGEDDLDRIVSIIRGCRNKKSGY